MTTNSHEGNLMEWQVIKEMHEYTNDAKSLKYDYETVLIRRNDGVTVQRIGMDREMNETFLCKGDFGEFKFRAYRWDPDKNAPTDKYVVQLCRPWIQAGTEALCQSMSKDIESALFNMPIHRFFRGVPINEVVFQLTANCNPKTFVHAQEVSSPNLG